MEKLFYIKKLIFWFLHIIFLIILTQSLHWDAVQVWQTIRSRCRDGFITLSIKSVHFFISKLMQYRYSISLVTPVYHSWTSRIIFWVTLTRSVSSMTNDTALWFFLIFTQGVVVLYVRKHVSDIWIYKDIEDLHGW